MKLRYSGFIALVITGLIIGWSYNTAGAKEIEWQTFSDGMARSKSENKKVLLHFYAQWCGACKIMESKTFQDPVVVAYLNKNFIPIKVDTDQEQKPSQMFRVRMLPDNWFIAEDGEPIGHRPGYIAPDQLKGILKMLLEKNTRQ